MKSVRSVTLLSLGNHVCRQTWPLIRHSFRLFWNKVFQNSWISCFESF